MAEAQAIALPSGYEDEFVNAVDEDLHCSICHLPLKEAVQTRKCGHRFCRQCLDEHFKRFVIQSISIRWSIISMFECYMPSDNQSMRLLYFNFPWLRLTEA